MSSEKQKNTIIKDALILLCITVIAGLALGFVYELTKEPIALANEKAKMEAYQKVFENAKEFVADEKVTAALGTVDDMLASSEFEGWATIEEVLVAKDGSGQPAGFVLSFTAKKGYGGAIKLSMGVDATGTITGLEVLSASETAGLGAKCQEPEFKAQYKGIQAEKVEFTKTGKSAPNEIDAISGATITTRAVTNAVNAALSFLATLK